MKKVSQKITKSISYRTLLTWLVATATVGLMPATAMAGMSKSHGDKESFTAATASSMIAEEVLDKDGRKVGEVADYVMTFGDKARLTHVLVGSGLFPAYSDPMHAIPVEILTWKDGAYHIDASSSQFEKTEKISDPASWINDRNAVTRLDRSYGVDTSDENLRHYLYSSLKTEDLITDEGREIGRISDVLISLNKKIVPYLLVNPTDPSINVHYAMRYGVPASDVHDIVKDVITEIRTKTKFNEIISARYVESMDDLTLQDNLDGIVISYQG